MQRERQFMADDVWDKILNAYIIPYMDMNSFCPPTFIGHKDSEPLINRKLPNRLRDVARVAPKMNIDIYSNGVLLPAWHKRGEDFIEFLSTLPNRVRYMMSYHPHNHDDSVNDYASVIAYMKGVLRDPPKNVEFITVSHTSKWTSKEDQDAWYDTWRGEVERKVLTVHRNVSISPWTGRTKEVATCEYDGCPYADFGSMFIGVTGNVIACCMDLEEEIVFGNVMRDDPAAMVAKLDEFYAAQRESQRSKTAPKYSVCLDCYQMGPRTDLVQVGLKV